jgi:hypothetical protein
VDAVIMAKETKKPLNGLMSLLLFPNSENLKIDVRIPHPKRIISMFLMFKK